MTVEQLPIAANEPARPIGSPGTSSRPAVRLEATILVVAPLQIVRNGMTFRSDRELRIRLDQLESTGTLRIYAVHNFHVEDTNPNLDEGILGIYVGARRGDGSWEEPEAFPIECRTLAVLGELRTSDAGDLMLLTNDSVSAT